MQQRVDVAVEPIGVGESARGADFELEPMSRSKSVMNALLHWAMIDSRRSRVAVGLQCRGWTVGWIPGGRADAMRQVQRNLHPVPVNGGAGL